MNEIDVKILGGVGEMKSNNGTQFFQQDRVYDSDALAPSMNASAIIPNIVEEVLIKQATNEGCIPCRVGGGSGLELPLKQNKTRKSNRERRDLPDSDNGEYP